MLTLKLRHLAGALVAATALFAVTADARSPGWRPRPMQPAFSVRIEDEQGMSLPTFRHEGKLFVLGTPGERYNVRVVNPTSQRVEAVVSVDGRDVVSGQVGDFVRQRGYLVPAMGSVLIEGFRRSMDDVATFRFTDPEDSFSARKGTPQNVGVIGVAFFNERMQKREVIAAPRRARSPEASAADSEAAPAKGKAGRARDAAAPEPRSAQMNNLGTEFGERRHSAVTEVPFERQNPMRPSQLVSVRYDDMDGLEARGIDMSSLGGRRVVRRNNEPEAFPVSRFASE